jgi:hypothetical protein
MSDDCEIKVATHSAIEELLDCVENQWRDLLAVLVQQLVGQSSLGQVGATMDSLKDFDPFHNSRFFVSS